MLNSTKILSRSACSEVYSDRNHSSMTSRLRGGICRSSESFTKTFSDKKESYSHHPKKNTLKRHLNDLEQNEHAGNDKVLVRPLHTDHHRLAKRLRSDWDLLFYNSEDALETGHGSAPSSQLQANSSTSRTTVKKQSFLVKSTEMKSFFHLIDDGIVQEFMSRDKCMRVTDKYLLAMVFAYFMRAGYKIREYTRMNFFVALYLANDMEEDEEELKYEIFPWALGNRWRDKFPKFLAKRDKLWAKIDHRAVVSRRCCDQIMAIEPDHPLWKRCRPEHHAGAIRSYEKGPDNDSYPRGPDASPYKCTDCDTDSQYDSASPESITWRISSNESSPESYKGHKPATTQHDKTFDMKGLKRTLTENDWPFKEE